MEILDHQLAVPDSELSELHSRLDRTRWPAELSDDWQRGMPVSYARRLVRYWREDYDWRAAESRLNALGQFTTEVDGQPIHGLHVPSRDPSAMPLLLCHGYPSSCFEFAGIAAELAGRTADAFGPAFHVVAPSIPGYGFSTPLRERGWDIARTAAAFDRIMAGLGYTRYAVFGEDVGAGIVEQLCLEAVERVIGSLVATDPGAIATEYTPPTDHLSDDEQAHHAELKAARREDFGYLVLQSTRPMSVAYALIDSPVAQAVWIVEKFAEWTDPSALLPEDAVDLEELLTLVSAAWFGRSGDGAANLLYETAHAQVAWGRAHDRPQGFTVFGAEPLVRRILDPDDRLAGWFEHQRGGHFPAMERPDDLVGDLRAFFGALGAA